MLPRRLRHPRAAGLQRELVADAGVPTPRCIHGDLHYENVLAGAREPWLAIDPQPLAGHPGWDAARRAAQPASRSSAPALRCAGRCATAPRSLCDAAGIDEEARPAWTIVRCAIECVWALDDADADEVSFNIALAKALDD